MPRFSRYGRMRVMSRRADLATTDASHIVFYGNRFNPKSIYYFLLSNLIDPADIHRYNKCDICDEGKAEHRSGVLNICHKCYEEDDAAEQN